jgi:hypothetical protein
VILMEEARSIILGESRQGLEPRSIILGESRQGLELRSIILGEWTNPDLLFIGGKKKKILKCTKDAVFQRKSDNTWSKENGQKHK